LINAVRPGTIPDKEICVKPNLNTFEVGQNHVSALRAARKIGCVVVNIGPQDLQNKTPHLILGLLWQIIRIGLMDAISIDKHPEIIALMQAGEDVNHFVNLAPEETLLRWFNYHLTKAGARRRVANFGTDVSDSENYLILLNRLDPHKCPMHAINETDLNKRAELMLQNAGHLGCRKFVSPQDVVHGNTKLNLAFAANLFNKYVGIENTEQDLQRQREAEAAWKNKIAAEEARLRQQWEAEESAFRNKLAQEESKLKEQWKVQEDQMRARLESEEAARRKAWEEEERKRKDQYAAEDRRRTEEEHKRRAEEERLKAEAERQRREEEMKKAQEEARMQQMLAAQFAAEEEAKRQWAIQQQQKDAWDKQQQQNEAAARAAWERQQNEAAARAAWEAQQQQLWAQTQTTVVTTTTEYTVIPKLFVTVAEARNLRMKVMIKPDPYCIVQHGDRRHQTRKEKSTTNPSWHQEFEFTNFGVNDEFIVSVYDKEHLMRDEFLGQVVLRRKDLIDGQRKWYALLSRPGCNDYAKGELFLHMRFAV